MRKVFLFLFLFIFISYSGYLKGASFNDIVITEVMADIPGLEGSDNGAYVELYNTTSSTLDVAGWYFTDGDAIDTIEAWSGIGDIKDIDVITNTTKIPPHAYAIILDRDYVTWADSYDFPPGTIVIAVDDSTIGNGLAESDLPDIRIWDNASPSNLIHTWQSNQDISQADGHSVDFVNYTNWRNPAAFIEETVYKGTPGRRGSEYVWGERDMVWIDRSIDLNGYVYGGRTNLILSVSMLDATNTTHTLKTLKIENKGSLPDNAINNIWLYHDDNGNDIFDAGIDTEIAELKWNGIDGWTNNNIPASLPLTNTKLLIVANIKYDTNYRGLTVQAEIPASGASCSAGAKIYYKVENPNPLIVIMPGDHVFTVTNNNIASTSYKKGDINVTVMSINITDSSNDTLHGFKIGNKGSVDPPGIGAVDMSSSDITAVKLWHDNGTTPGTWDSGDTFVCTLTYDGTYWANNNITDSSNLKNGQNFIVTIDISSTATKGSAFRAYIPAYGIHDLTGFGGPFEEVVNDGEQHVGDMAGNVVISEVCAGISGAAEDYVEIYNPTSSAIDISGWDIAQDSSSSAGSLTPSSKFTFPAGTVIQPYSFILLADDDATNYLHVTNNIIADFVDSYLGFTYSGYVLLRDSSDNVIDYVGYGSLTDPSLAEGGAAAPGLSAGESIERKARINSTLADMTNGGLHHLLGNSWDSDLNSADFILRPTIEPQNSSFKEDPRDRIELSKTDVPDNSAYKGTTNVVMTFKAYNTTTANIQSINIRNLGTANGVDIPKLLLYYASDPTVIIGTSTYSTGIWSFSGLSVFSGSNLIVKAVVSTNVVFGHTFKGYINYNDVSSVDGVYNITSSITNNGFLTIDSRPPAVLSISLGNTAVSNTGNDYLDISQVIITNKGDGIIAVSYISNKFGVYTNFNIAFSNWILPGKKGVWTNHHVLIPNTVAPTNSFLVVRAYDSQGYKFLSNQTEFTVMGDWPPVIQYSAASPNAVFASGLSSISSVTMLVYVKDRDGTNKAAYLDLSSIGLSSSQPMSNISGATLWRYIATVPSGISAGTKSIKVTVIDDEGAYNTTQNQYISLTIKAHSIPLANAGNDITVSGKNRVTITGSGTSYDGTTISGYQWIILTNNTGESCTLENANSKTVSFIAPNVNGDIILGLIVTDNWGYNSNPDAITVHINISYSPDLSEAHPYNTVITPDKDKATFVNLSKGTVITIYTVTGNKVAEIEATSDTAEWDIPSYLAAGVYIVYMKDESGNIKKSKIVVIR